MKAWKQFVWWMLARYCQRRCHEAPYTFSIYCSSDADRQVRTNYDINECLIILISFVFFRGLGRGMGTTWSPCPGWGRPPSPRGWKWTSANCPPSSNGKGVARVSSYQAAMTTGSLRCPWLKGWCDENTKQWNNGPGAPPPHFSVENERILIKCCQSLTMPGAIVSFLLLLDT